MKKRLICSIVLIMFSFLFISNVEAAITCTYYPREAFDGEKIKDDKKNLSVRLIVGQNVAIEENPRARIEWQNSQGYMINTTGCNKMWFDAKGNAETRKLYLSGVNIDSADVSNLFFCDKNQAANAGLEQIWEALSENSYTVYDAVWQSEPGISQMIDEEGECPLYIIEKLEKNSDLIDIQVGWFVSFFFDDLSYEKAKNDQKFFGPNFLQGIQHWTDDAKYLYLEGHDPAQIDTNGCLTYDYYMTALKNARANHTNSRGEPDPTCENNQEFSRKYQKINDLCNAYRSSAIEYTISNKKNDNNDSNNSNVVRAKACMTACSSLRDDIAIICHEDDMKQYSCQSLGPKIIDWMYKIIRVVRYGVPIMLIILSVMDFIRAMSEDSEDEMKKATARFGKRLIAAALVFLVPFVLDFILGMFNLPGLNDPFCTG